MDQRLTTRLSTLAFLLFFAVVSGLIFCALQPLASASERAPGRFICAARVDCGAPGLPSTQDLPSIRTPTVTSRTLEGAREKCMRDHVGAYARLAKTVDGITPTTALQESRGCKIVSEAFRAE